MDPNPPTAADLAQATADSTRAAVSALTMRVRVLEERVADLEKANG